MPLAHRRATIDALTTPQGPRLTESVQYEASFPATLTDDAGRRFTDHVYRRMFGWKIAACVLINLVACVAGVLTAGWTAVTISFIVLIGMSTLYFIGNYFLRPWLISQRLLRAFGRGAKVTLRPDGFDIEVGPNKLSRRWGQQRAIVESDHYFLLVILPVMGLVLPRQGMPEQGVAWVRAAMAGPMTKGRFFGYKPQGMVDAPSGLPRTSPG